MALSGVRSSWLILARNCDLCWLATSSWRLLSWISSNKPHILDGDHRLVGEGGEQADLLFREGLWSGSREPYHTDWNAFAQERHAETDR